jgi:hypothetical protein
MAEKKYAPSKEFLRQPFLFSERYLHDKNGVTNSHKFNNAINALMRFGEKHSALPPASGGEAGMQIRRAYLQLKNGALREEKQRGYLSNELRESRLKLSGVKFDELRKTLDSFNLRITSAHEHLVPRPSEKPSSLSKKLTPEEKKILKSLKMTPGEFAENLSTAVKWANSEYKASLYQSLRESFIKDLYRKREGEPD